MINEVVGTSTRNEKIAMYHVSVACKSGLAQSLNVIVEMNVTIRGS